MTKKNLIFVLLMVIPAVLFAADDSKTVFEIPWFGEAIGGLIVMITGLVSKYFMAKMEQERKAIQDGRYEDGLKARLPIAFAHAVCLFSAELGQVFKDGKVKAAEVSKESMGRFVREMCKYIWEDIAPGARADMMERWKIKTDSEFMRKILGVVVAFVSDKWPSAGAVLGEFIGEITKKAEALGGDLAGTVLAPVKN